MPTPPPAASRRPATPPAPAPGARAARRDRRIAGTALALVLPAVLAGGGCGPATARPPDAAIAVDGPDCTATEVLGGLGVVPPEGHDRPAPAAGSVPAGFEPVAAVHCRGPLDAPVALVEPPDLRATTPAAPTADAVAPESTTPPDAAPVTVVEARLEGDLGPLLGVLARPSQVAPPGQACPAMWESQPQVYLVDADGRAVRVSWPSDVCGFLLGGVTRPLGALEVVRTVTRTVDGA